MKLRYTAFIFTGVTTACCLAVLLCSPIRYSLLGTAAVIVAFSAWILVSVYIFMIRRIEKLDRQILKIRSNYAPSLRVPNPGNDEITAVGIQINNMLEVIATAHEKFNDKVEARTEELAKQNIQLKEQIAEQVSSAKTLAWNRECLTQLANYDNLTSLPNRVFFNEMLNKAINHARRHDKVLAILSIDIDGFSKVTEDHGEAAGEAVLKELGTRFSSALRTEDVIAKLDGEEFIALLTDIGKPKFASVVAGKLLQICSQPIHINAKEILLTCSVGICVYPIDGTSLEDLIKNSYQALYKAKHAGGANYQFYTSDMALEAREYMQLGAALRNAITNKEFVLYYQPKVHIKRGTISGVEALLRWNHPELGVLSPAKFVPIAEEMGLITQIGEWALHEACKTTKSWQDEGHEHVTVSVNLSAKQFFDPAIVA